MNKIIWEKRIHPTYEIASRTISEVGMKIFPVGKFQHIGKVNGERKFSIVRINHPLRHRWIYELLTPEDEIHRRDTLKEAKKLAETI